MPDRPELLALPVRERLRLIDSGELSTVEYRAAADGWSAAADTRYRACVEWRAAGPDPAPIRLGVKDTVDVAGFATRLGLRRYRHHPTRSAAPLRGLSKMDINAKVVTTELNIGVGSGCVNPYFPHISPAGSSTGSGVAVAAGICDISLGTDVLGSVRWPAGRCGVVGLRVTHDERLLPGVYPLCPPMDAPGWVARTADDLACLWPYLGLGPVAGFRPVRVGLAREALEADLEPAVRAALDTGVAALEQAGHTVTPVHIGQLWDWRGPAWELCARDAWDGYLARRSTLADDLLDSTIRALAAGQRVSDERQAELRAALHAQRAQVAQRFADQGVTAWLLPLDPDVPRPLEPAARPVVSTIPTPDDPGYDREVGYTPVASFAGLPALTFPVGCTGDTGAPLALQLIGAPHTEPTLIGLARDAAGILGDLGYRPG